MWPGPWGGTDWREGGARARLLSPTHTSLRRYALRTHCLPGTVLVTEDAAGSRQTQSPVLMELSGRDARGTGDVGGGSGFSSTCVLCVHKVLSTLRQSVFQTKVWRCPQGESPGAVGGRIGPPPLPPALRHINWFVLVIIYFKKKVHNQHK